MPDRTDSFILMGDALTVLKNIPSETFQCCITSPPYWGLRDYGMDKEIGKEETVGEYVDNLVEIFREVRRCLKSDGSLWLNIGDSYTSGGRKWRAPDKKNPARQMQYRPETPIGLKEKELVGVPWKVAFALQKDGWYLRSDIIWNKPNCMPESVRDRPTKSHEYVFLLTKCSSYYYNREAVFEEGGRNRRSVWEINTKPFNGAHFATFPPGLVELCVKAGTMEEDFVLDPFFGSGTTGIVTYMLNRFFVGIELNPAYVELAGKRLVEHIIVVPVYESWSEAENEQTQSTESTTTEDLLFAPSRAEETNAT